MIELSVTGMDVIARRLLNMERKLRTRTIKKAMTAAAKPIHAAAKARAPKAGGKGSTGALEAAIIYSVREKKRSKGTSFKAVIGVQTKAGRPRPNAVSRGKNKGKVQLNLPTRTAHMIEYGFTHKRGTKTTQVPPKPFMRPAWQEAGGEKALGRFWESLRDNLPDPK